MLWYVWAIFAYMAANLVYIIAKIDSSVEITRAGVVSVLVYYGLLGYALLHLSGQA